MLLSRHDHILKFLFFASFLLYNCRHLLDFWSTVNEWLQVECFIFSIMRKIILIHVGILRWGNARHFKPWYSDQPNFPASLGHHVTQHGKFHRILNRISLFQGVAIWAKGWEVCFPTMRLGFESHLWSINQEGDFLMLSTLWEAIPTSGTLGKCPKKIIPRVDPSFVYKSR